MKIVLDEKLFAYFCKDVLPRLTHPDSIQCIPETLETRYGAVLASDETAEEIVEYCLDRFARVGLQQDYEPNEEGLVLETLIDRFNTAT